MAGYLGSHGMVTNFPELRIAIFTRLRSVHLNEPRFNDFETDKRYEGEVRLIGKYRSVIQCANTEGIQINADKIML